MKNKIAIVSIAFLLVSFLHSIPSYSQVIELGTKQELAVSGITSLPFSSISNSVLKDNFLTNPTVTLTIENFFGSPVKITAQADFTDIGSSLDIKGGGTYSLDFSMANPNTNTYGLSANPLFGPSVFALTANSTKISTSSSSSGQVSSSSSSGLVTSSSSSSGFVPGQAALTISGPDKLTLNSKGTNQVKYITTASNFVSSSNCKVYTSNDPLVMITPRIFSLNENKNQKVIEIKVPLPFALNLIATATSKSLTIVISCENGAREQVILSIEP